VASPARKPAGEAYIGLGGSVHEEAHSCFIQPSFKGIGAGSIYHPLVQLIPSITLFEKNTYNRTGCTEI